MPYAKKRHSIFGSVLSAVNLNFDNSLHEKRKKLFRNSIIDYNNYNKVINNNNSSENNEQSCDQMNYNSNEKCCYLEHILKIGKSDRIEF
jgi:hypothetical protein